MAGKTTIWLALAVLVLTVFAQQAAAFTLDNICIGYTGHREDGTLEDYDFYIDVQGTGITNVRVVDQYAVTYNLYYNPPPGWTGWNWWDNYASLTDLWTAHPNNQTYDFYFNEGQPDADHDVLSYNVTAPSGFPTILYPGNGDTGVPTNPVYVWGSVAGVSNAVCIYTEVETTGEADDESIYEKIHPGLTATTWYPGPLDPLSTYAFNVGPVNLHGGAPQAETTDCGVGYTYYGVFEESNSVDFTTGTGTMPALWLTVTASAEERYVPPNPPSLPDYDEFRLRFDCDNDIRLTHIAYNLGTAAAELFFDTTYVSPSTGPGFPFTILPSSDNVDVTTVWSLDNSPLLGIECNDFHPGETLIFGIDVDGTDCTTFTAADFDNAWIGLIFDPSPSFPGADPFLVQLYFDGTSASTEVPEPTTVLLFAGGVTVMGLLRRRRLASTRGRKQ